MSEPLMRVLITGAHGQVGHCLTQQLTNKAEILAVDRAELDITDSTAVNHTVEKFQPHIIINAAAHTAVDKAETEVDLSYAINRDGPMYLAKAAHSARAALLHISTDYVFAGDKQGLYLETDTPDPQGIYGESKLAGEIAVAENCSKHIILRTAWVFGEQGSNFVRTMLRLGKDRDSLGVVSDQFGGPTYARDVAAALITIAEKIHKNEQVEFGLYHYSGFPHVSWHQFAQKIFEQAHQQSILARKPVINAIGTEDYPTPAKRPENSKLCTDKIEQNFAIEASDWQAALKQLKDYQ
ncbi:dTDP-4-dehydrorhamnose reductase subunit, NAD(P)-binding, of dTDP-L-rhamnose synthase [Vibrio tapetis subsp. tapetis]|uniref:dTDP-4-dehydrorhamnose reductase n=2 Tax=Vibrio tapetis TaxID=52443 RepID=A0A2N8ZGL1_9VIBR|nr:dTDP-4-dehydrorhamnose reductase subunit, NAD(P)-binding, of dTDP-L-rhamnose synthase [Vibrio tapetis subsp. tapetis]